MRTVLLLASALLLGGCGSGTVIRDGAEQPSVLPGAEVAVMAERQLEAGHPRMARGTMTCPDLDFRVGSHVRCVRRTELSGGRVVRVAGTVEVTSRRNGGRLHVALDDKAIGFEMSPAWVRAQVERRTKVPGLTCTKLDGRIGATGSCTHPKHTWKLRVVRIDAGQYRAWFAVE